MPVMNDQLPTPAESRPERGVHSWKVETDRELMLSVYDSAGRRVMRAFVPVDADRDDIEDRLQQWLDFYEATAITPLRLIG